MTGWNDARIEVLRNLWGEGLSASEIAKTIGGVTRNAVIGKAHRLKLGEKGKPHNASVPTAKKEGTPIPKAVKALVKMQSRAEAVAAAPAPVVLEFVMPPALALGTDAVFQLTEQTCKWPEGDPMSANFRFCGAHRSRDDKAPYCKHHIGLAYQSSSSRSVRSEPRRISA